MCGRYAASRPAEDLAETFGIRPEGLPAVPPDYNVAPTKPVPAVLTRRSRPGAGPARELRLVQWGLVPPWATDPSIGGRLINARVETVAVKPAYRAAFATRRCLLPADGYYEWYAGTAGPVRQPFFLRPADGGLLVFAGLYQRWQQPGGDGPELWSATILTTAATDAAGRIHDRMPMTVAARAWSGWLDPDRRDPHAALELLDRPGVVPWTSVPVGPEVGNVRANGPQLLTPAAAAPAQAALF